MINITVDISDLSDTIKRLQGNLSESNARRLMPMVFRKTGSHARKILKTEIPKEYEVKVRPIEKAVKRPIIGGGGMSCVIPIRGKLRSLGAEFATSGGMPGWTNVGHKYRISARILKGKTSLLPAEANSYGGNPPFTNTSAGSIQPQYSGLRKLAMTRVGNSMQNMKGIAIPHMAMNRSREDIERELHDFLERQLYTTFSYLLTK